jgi:hypothetical protein
MSGGEIEGGWTPGPWQFEPHAMFGSDFDGTDGIDFPLGYISTSPTPQPIFGLEVILDWPLAELEANARLIALAPEMFEYIESSASNGCATAQGLVRKALGK